MTIGVALIGLGRIGMTNDPADPPHSAVLTHAKAIHESPVFRLEAGIDPRDTAREEFSRRYSAPAFASVDLLPEPLGQDVVVLAAPTSHHASLVKILMERTVPKALLLEKPVGGSLHQAEAIASLCAGRSTQVFVNYHRAVLGSTRIIGDLIRSEAIRSPYSGDALVSGELLTNASHMVDLLLEWLGPVTETRVDTTSGALWLDFDNCRILLRRAKPGTFSIFELALVADNGRLRYDGWNDRWWWEDVTNDPLTAGYTCLDEPRLNSVDGVTTFMAAVYAELAKGLEGRPSRLRRMDRALEVHRILEGWCSSND